MVILSRAGCASSGTPAGCSCHRSIVCPGLMDLVAAILSSCCGPVAARAATAPVVAPLAGPGGPVTTEEYVLRVDTLALP